MATALDIIEAKPLIKALLMNGTKLVGTIAHEVEHVARGHHVRRGNRDPDLWNIACDHSINTNLKRGGFELPGPAELDGADICSDPQFDGMAAEEVYAILAQQAQSPQAPQPQQQQGDEQQAGNGGASDDQSGADQDGDDGQAGNSDQGQGQASPNGAPSQSPQNGQGQASTGQGSDSSGQGQDASGAPAQGDGDGNQGQASPGAAPSPRRRQGLALQFRQGPRLSWR